MARIFGLKRVNLWSPGEHRPEVDFRQAGHSCAIHDTLEAIPVPNVEVHLFNVHPREEVLRHTSVIFPVVDGAVGGMGVYGYRETAGYTAGYTLSVGPSEI